VRPGEVLAGRFRIEARVNAGGMGEIFRACDLRSDELCALKILTDLEEESASRFEREAAILASLSHPGIVRYLAYEAPRHDKPMLAMEWLEGEDLGRFLARRTLSVEETITLGAHVAEALGAAHAKGIVHRDLKPQNIFLIGGTIASTKILDFGIAHWNARSRITQTGTVIGTPCYMAPEQARSGSLASASADVFSLGCVLFECLTGQPPFRADHTIAVLAKIMFEEAPRASGLVSFVPAWLDRLIARMLAKDPASRPQDGAAIAAALRSRKELEPESLESPGSSLPRSSLGGQERRFRGVVLRGRDGASAKERAPDATLTSSPSTEIADIADRFGAELATFADGTAALIVDRTQVPTDVAAHIARCALALGELAPGTPMAVAAGFGERARGLPVGEAIDRAARLLHSHGSSPRITLDETTASLLDARFEVFVLPDNGFSLIRERSCSESFRPLLGKATPTLGRDHELGLLELSFADCVREPSARVVVVSGAAGIGKSRLVHELLERHKRDPSPLQVWSFRGDPLRAASSFGLLAEMLRATSGLQGGEPLVLRRELFSARIAERVSPRDHKRVALFLGELAGIPFPDDDDLPLRAARQDPELLGEQMQRALRDFLRAECSAGPLILLLEDVQWSDRASVLALDAVLIDLAFEPVFLLATARPEVDEVFPGLWSSRGRQDIRLRPLSPRACQALTRHVLGEDATRSIIERLVASSEGHPFFLEELLRAAAEGRTDSPPSTVVAMVQSRLERLEPIARRILRAASILGGVYWSGAVARLAGETKASVDAVLGSLASREICFRERESRFPGEEQWAFRQALFREGAYVTLTDEDRVLGHRLAGEWLEEKGEADPLVLAEHYERGGLSFRAAELWVRGAEGAAARKDYLDADRCYGRAFALWGYLPVLAHRGRGLARFRLGHYAEALTELSAAREKARDTNENLVEVEVLLDEAMVLDWMGDYRGAEARVLCAAASHVGTTSALLEARLLLGIGRSQHRAERYEEAAITLSRTGRLAARLGDEGYETKVIALLLLGYILPLLGRLEEAAGALDEVIRYCDERGDLLHLGAARNCRAMVQAFRGDRAGMIEDFGRTIELGMELGQPTLELAGHYNLAEYLYWMDDADAALRSARAASAVATRRKGCARPAVLALLDARLALFQGDVAAASVVVRGLRKTNEAMSPSEEVLCSMIELSIQDASDEIWDLLLARSAQASVGQEHLEVLEACALSAARRGFPDLARRRLEDALAAAARIPNVMRERLERRLCALSAAGDHSLQTRE